ncbi:MAG TPA: hypothetical protein VH413_11390 [Verrucomicrobiae bacterium]|jgi:RNase H-fold protein (predicted Holliday junction resolvase)|nr:hypothetical protein [Verrucomicrobiae bacterium]
MNRANSKQFRILAITPSSRGFGFAVLEGQEHLVNWGVKSVVGDKNAESIKKISELLTLYEPKTIVIQNTLAKDSRRSPRIQILCQEISNLATKHKIKARLFSRTQINKAFFAGEKRTKHEIAKILAKRFPQELGSRLPPERKAWMSADYRMDIFDAVALAMINGLQNERKLS